MWCKSYLFWNWLSLPGTMWIGQRETLKAQEECNQQDQGSMIAYAADTMPHVPQTPFSFPPDHIARSICHCAQQLDGAMRPNDTEWGVGAVLSITLSASCSEKSFAQFSSLVSSLICHLYSEESGRLWGMMEPLFRRGLGHTTTVDLSGLSIPTFIRLP